MRTNILEYLYEAAAKWPARIAFSNGEEGLTFSELLDKTEAVAAFLRQNGVSTGPVGVFMERSPLEIAVFLGVIRAGCFYVPMDMEMGSERLNGICDRMRLDVLIADAAWDKEAAFLGCEKTFRAEDALAFEGRELEKLHTCDTEPAYTVFTSGSTGLPKGVCGCHRAVIDYAEHMLPAIGLSDNAVMGCQAPLYFDACFKEILGALVKGASVYLIPRTLFSRPLELIAYLNRHEINTICWVSSALTLVSALNTFKYVKPESLRLVCFGSEVFPPKHLNAWMNACPAAKFVNLYGPTECTGMSCCYHVEGPAAEGESIPVGKPFPNTRLFLLDEDGKAGQEGEIVIGGTCVTLGYYNDPIRTAQAFTQNPLHNDYPDIVYRTGDLGRFNDNGDLVFLGRADQQIKRMGHRIELGEIESAASAVPGAGQAVCLFDKNKGLILLLYTGEADEKRMQETLLEKLPAFAQPNRFIRLNTMPVTPNGKADRRTLKETYLGEKA